MKYFLSLLIMAWTFVACKHDAIEVIPGTPIKLVPNEYTPGLREFGWASAIKLDSIDWQASAKGGYFTSSLTGRKYVFCDFTTHSAGSNFLREDIFIQLIPLGCGTYRIDSETNESLHDENTLYASCGLLLGEGDEHVMSWNMNPDFFEEDYLKITMIDTISDILEGEFSMHFVADSVFKANSWIYAEYPCFKKGEFKCQIAPW